MYFRLDVRTCFSNWSSLYLLYRLPSNARHYCLLYIINHELCHLKIQGHSYHFWSFFKQFVPIYFSLL
ncbi:MAG: YgjP-like metallopeptidase domain-containing protein [Nitrososphaeraceae archaeon]